MRWVPPGNHVQHPAGTNQQLTFATEHATELEEPATVLEEKHLHKNQLFSPEYRSFVCLYILLSRYCANPKARSHMQKN